jgi:plastocyanin
MPIRDVYLKIEPISDYSPVEPEQKVMPPKLYRRDCMRNPGHEDTTIPQPEVDARRLTALVYREYLDAHYLVPKPDKLVAADVNEPVFYRRVPGAVLYAQPGDRLRIHVLNGDILAHSFHIHGLRYGIDSDGSWPLGTQSSDRRRSDEICPGQNWTYTFDITDEMTGAWPFHDHSRHLGDSINRGLFGGLVVRPRDFPCPLAPLVLPSYVEQFVKDLRERFQAPPPGLVERLQEWALLDYVHPFPHPPAVIEVPMFFHFMAGTGSGAAFDSGPLAMGASFPHDFPAAGTYSYHCTFHPYMHGKVNVAAGKPTPQTVSIEPDPMNPGKFRFNPETVEVAPGGKVIWTNTSMENHTVTDDGGGISSFCLNGRSFVGNTPTILAQAGQKIRWYVFNLDLGEVWHNFHTHGQRWKFADKTIDVRSLSPAESFVVETTAPPALLLPPEIEATQNPPHRPPDAKEYKLRGDFLFHCHVEMHMGQGLAGLVRSRQTVWLTPKQADQLAKETGLPLDPGDNACPIVDLDRCAGCGKWQEVAGDPAVTMMHAALLPQTNKVLYWGYVRLDQSRLWDYSTPAGVYSTPNNQPGDVAPGAPPPNPPFCNLHSAGHAFLDTNEGTLLAHGGESSGEQQTLLFHPGTMQWERKPPTAKGRFYASTFTLADGKLLTLFGSLGPDTIEVYDPAAAGGTWSAPKPLPATFDYRYYPWTYLLPGGELFIAGHQKTTRRFDWTANPIVDDPAKRWDASGDRSPAGAEKGTSVLLPLRPPNYEPRILNAAGSTAATQQTAEIIDLSLATPAWTALPPLKVPRPDQCTAVLLPDGKVFLAGGVTGPPFLTEIFDPANPTEWALCGEMKYRRGYHSTNILLADGSVLMGGDPADAMTGKPTPHERFFPAYYFMPRPAITTVLPATTFTYGAALTIQSPNAPTIAEVVLLRPGAATHGWNQSQRFIGCEITGVGAAAVQAKAPANATIAPPGWYLLFIVNNSRVPSVATWIRLH